MMFQCGVVKQGFAGLLMVPGAAYTESKFLSLTPTAFSTVAGAVLVLLLYTSSQVTAADMPVLASTDCDRIVGTWRWFNGAKVKCLGNGRCEATNGFSGPWKCLDPAGRVEIRWSRGSRVAQYVDTLNIATDGSKLSGTNQFGVGVSASRAASATPSAALPVQRGPVASGSCRGCDGSGPAQVALSRDQQETVELLGWPHAFTLWRDPSGKHHEAWTWFDSGMTYFFVNREFLRWEPAALLSLNVDPTLWRPTQFRLGTSEKILRDELKSQRWESLELFELIDGTKGIAADGVVLSFDSEGLRVVETWTEGR